MIAVVIAACSGAARDAPRSTASTMGELLVRHPAAWRYLSPESQPAGGGSLFGWLTNATAHKPCKFWDNGMTCRPPVRSLSPGDVFVSAGAMIQLAPPLDSTKRSFIFAPNRVIDGHPAELTHNEPRYLSACPTGTTGKSALIIEMAKAPADFDTGIWYLTACTADADQTIQANISRMFATVRIGHQG
jgi:hypothetical protein